jgi:hypothetical protein
MSDKHTPSLRATPLQRGSSVPWFGSPLERGARQGGVCGLLLLLLVLCPALFAADAPLVLGFDVLASFPYQLPEASAAGAKETVRANQIPASVQAFSGKRAIVSGYMMPLQLEEGKARQFVLVRNQASCCYGVAPNLNEYVLVTMAAGVRPVMDVPIAVVGTLKVGETFEDGLLVGIYQLEGEKVEEPKS